ncbi:MAG: sensor histidine kinase [Taibaiella sp.]|nr:sensor histidine kinase [Taibaiella sp.]
MLVFLLPFPGKAVQDTTDFEQFLIKGDSVYRIKQGYASFSQSLVYFDSAQQLAERSADKRMLAAATFARAKVYDAWNREPLKTIALYAAAAELFRQSGEEQKYLYTKHLVAHAYDKVKDKAGAGAVLRSLILELVQKDSTERKAMLFIPELALIATEVAAYDLADSILTHLTKREWIKNDPKTYNYLDHYYLSCSRLDIYYRKKKNSVYLDSLVAAYQKLSTLSDQLYYAQQLHVLYDAIGDRNRAYQYIKDQNRLQDLLFAGDDFEKMQQSLILSETAAERRKTAYEATISKWRAYGLWGLGLLLVVITVLSIYLHKKNKKYRIQSLRLAQTNAALDQQIGNVELMNKEIQHRIKNNLYTIYSLLHMQQESTDNEEVILHLETARLRVESIATLHDHLLGNCNEVDFGAYIKILVNKVIACYEHQRKVVTHIITEPVTLPLNTCFALSLILNEWITNSIKYARSAAEVLNMDICIRNNGSFVSLAYKDDGIVPDKITEIKSGLGTEIVKLLIAQIKGQFSVIKDHPYHFNLFIPYGEQQ